LSVSPSRGDFRLAQPAANSSCTFQHARCLASHNLDFGVVSHEQGRKYVTEGDFSAYPSAAGADGVGSAACQTTLRALAKIEIEVAGNNDASNSSVLELSQRPLQKLYESLLFPNHPGDELCPQKRLGTAQRFSESREAGSNQRRADPRACTQRPCEQIPTSPRSLRVARPWFR
jgi:hypothetical protein